MLRSGYELTEETANALTELFDEFDCAPAAESRR